MPARAMTRGDMVGPSCLPSGQVPPACCAYTKPGDRQEITEPGKRGCALRADLQQVVEDLGQCDLAPISAQLASLSVQQALPQGASWDEDAGVPGVIIASVEADPFRGERCAFCGRACPGEQEAGTNQALGAGDLWLIERLIEAAWEHKTSCAVQIGRGMCLVAFYLGLLPDCHTEADLANHLGVDPGTLSRAKLLLPPELQALCHLHRRPREPRSPQL
jgi:hypothetical protein